VSLAWLRRALPAFIALSIASSSANVAALPSDPDAKAHLDKGNALFQEGDFEGAAEEYRKGYEIEDDPAFLYTWAQAERRRGRCAAAVKLYQRYIATNPPDVSAEYAREGIVKCADEMAAEEAMPPGDERPGTLDDPTGPADAGTAAPVQPPPAKTSQRDRWYRDPAAASLVALGVAGVGVGTGLLVASALEKDKNSANYGEFDARQKRVRTFQISGAVVLGVGVGLLAGGIVRWAVLGRREKKKNTNVSAMLGRGTAGVVFTGRF
jgi:tetratricopeptide (TPR) repeat protein